TVALTAGNRPAQLVATPVFRFDDQPRRILDATLWVWTDGARPVAFEKIEAIERTEPRWSHCFTSLAPERLAVQWRQQRRFESTEPGIHFQPTGLPPVAGISERKRQMRELAREFVARIIY